MVYGHERRINMVEEKETEQKIVVPNINDDNLTEEELFPVASIDISTNGMSINTGNNYLDVGVFVTIILVAIFFIYAKYIKGNTNEQS